MRAHQLLLHTKMPIEKPVNIVLAPITCKCRARVDAARYRHHSPRVTVTIGGIEIEDAEVDFRCYALDGGWMEVAFTGTVVLHIKGGINDAIEWVKGASVEMSGRGVTGMARDVTITVGEIVTLVQRNGKVFQLVGANRNLD